MPPRLFSRYTFVKQVDDGGDPARVFLSDRERYLYRDLPDNIIHIVRQGDSCHRLAARIYAALSDPPDFSAASLWWVIADFQPTPVHDPTVVLVPGATLIIPSLRTLQDQILNPSVRRSRGL